MAKFVLKNVVANYDGRNMSGELSSISINTTRDVPEITAFGNTARVRVAGLMDVTVDQSGFWDLVSAADDLDGDLFAKLGAAGLISISPDGGTVGDVGYTTQILGSSYVPGATIGEVFAFNINTTGNGPLVRGTVMTNEAVTVTGGGTGTQLAAAATTDTTVSVVHVTAFDGTSIDVIAETDVTDAWVGAETTRMTHPQFTAVGADRQTAVGAITDTWWRHQFTVVGTTFTVFGVIGKYQTLTP